MLQQFEFYQIQALQQIDNSYLRPCGVNVYSIVVYDDEKYSIPIGRCSLERYVNLLWL
jgi:hypothetical protein